MKWEVITNHEGKYCGWEATRETERGKSESGTLYYYCGPMATDGHPIVIAEPGTRVLRSRLSIGSKTNNPYLSKDSLFPLLLNFVQQEKVHQHHEEILNAEPHIREIKRMVEEDPRKSKYHTLLFLKHLNYDGEFSDPWYKASEEVLSEMMIDACVSGSERLDLVAKAIRAIETKTEYLISEIAGGFPVDNDEHLTDEQKFLALIERVTLQKEEPPSKKDLRVAFDRAISINQDTENQRIKFTRLITKLGFDWLPKS